MNITLNLPSVVTGGSVALVLGLLAGFSPQVTQVPAATNIAPRHVTGQFSPHPSQVVYLEACRPCINCGNVPAQYDSTLLTIPNGKVFVVSSLNTTSSANPLEVTLEIDGADRRTFKVPADGYRSFGQTGLVLEAGQTLRVVSYPSNVTYYSWLHGYWADV